MLNLTDQPLNHYFFLFFLRSLWPSMQHLKKLSFSIPLFLPYICCTYTRQIFWGDPFSEKHSALKERKKRSDNKSQITERAVVVAAMKRNCKRCNHLTILFASCCPQWFLKWTAVKWQLSCLLSAFGYSHIFTSAAHLTLFRKLSLWEISLSEKQLRFPGTYEIPYGHLQGRAMMRNKDTHQPGLFSIL